MRLDIHKISSGRLLRLGFGSILFLLGAVLLIARALGWLGF